MTRYLPGLLLLASLLQPVASQAQDIGVVLAGNRGLFWTAMAKGIDQAAADLGVEVLARSPPDDDPATIAQNMQLKIVRYMVESGVKGLIIAPMPLADMPTPVDLPVPVVFVDRSGDAFKALSTIATDNYAAGRASAGTLRGVLPKGARIAVLRLAPYVVSTTAREAGFIDAAHEMGFTIALDTYLTHGIREAESAAADVLAPYRGHIAAVFTPTGKLTESLERVLDGWPPDQRPLLAGFDYEPNFETNLRDRSIYSIVVQDAFQMGYQAVQQLIQFRAGTAPEPDTKVDFIVVTSGNVDDPKIHTALGQYRD